MSKALPEWRFHRLLVAVDGSESADLALAAAITAARRDHAALTVISVAPKVSSYPGAIGVAPHLQQEIDEATQRVLREAVERIPKDVPVTTVFRHGKPGAEIVAFAEEGRFDAILLGARGVGRLAGSVSRYVMHHASIAVLVAHPPAHRD